MRGVKLPAVAGFLCLAGSALADPCGMVPPIYTGPGLAITRVGPQRTYVFYKDGLETYVIRPGFSGKVDNFGMLIPFPSVPSLRKAPDEIFTQITAAIDPPEVILDLRPRYRYSVARGGAVPAAKAAREEAPLAVDEVRVLKQEAVGMYEVVVLAAGSAKALDKWMGDHGYVYPKGMDEVVQDYVKKSWVFVAEKTKVAEKGSTDPQPGQRSVTPGMPTGSSFDGYVQGMGFRFKVEQPILPMRLSPFNEGEKRQIVYVLDGDPLQIEGIPEKLVVRQLAGGHLFRNVTDPLPIRVIGGDPSEVTQAQIDALKPQRDPRPHNGMARDLFASDLLAVRTGKLELSFEEKEKELLNIGEALNLRGPQIDTLHEAEVEAARDKEAGEALADLKWMSLTVLDGEFPLDYLEAHDLTFSHYRMPDDLNGPIHYDAKLDGPAGVREGKVLTGTRTWYQNVWEEVP